MLTSSAAQEYSLEAYEELRKAYNQKTKAEKAATAQGDGGGGSGGE